MMSAGQADRYQDWARALESFPFGMKSQLDECRERLDMAKNLWQDNRWYQAYEVARKSQEAMNNTQDLYKSLYVSLKNSQDLN